MEIYFLDIFIYGYSSYIFHNFFFHATLRVSCCNTNYFFSNGNINFYCGVSLRSFFCELLMYQNQKSNENFLELF